MSKVVTKDLAGTVKWMNSKKGYGMILAEVEDKEQDVFFHYTEIQSSGFKYIPENVPVLFDLSKQDKPGSNGWKALNVRVNV